MLFLLREVGGGGGRVVEWTNGIWTIPGHRVDFGWKEFELSRLGSVGYFLRFRLLSFGQNNFINAEARMPCRCLWV